MKNMLPNVGLGCFPLSLEAVDDKRALNIIKAAFSAGYRLFNTANTYNNGRSEKLLNRGLGSKRKEVIIVSKGGFTQNYQHSGKPNQIIRTCEESLKRLGTDYIDIYELHSPDPRVPIEESMQAFVKLQEDGKILHTGVSKASFDEIRRANKIINLLTVELEYSIRVKDVEREILSWCDKNKKYLLAYVPLGRGYLAGNLETKTKGLVLYNNLYKGKELKRTIEGVDKLKPLAKRMNSTLAQLSLSYLLNKSKQVVVIPGATRAWQVVENYIVSDIKLTKKQLEFISGVFTD